MVDDSTALADAKLVRTVALLLATPPEPRREILAMMAEPVLAGATKAKYHAHIDQYSPLVPAMMERARALVGRHRTEAVTATMFEVISAEERTRWDRGERQGFAHYAPLIMPGRIIVHLFRLDQGLRRRAGL